MNIGDKLKSTRQKKGITIEDIQKNTKIRLKYLKAIEENNFKVIPGHIYTKSFIKEYAKQIDLDEEELINEYQKIINVKSAKRIKQLEEANNKDDGKNRNNEKNIFEKYYNKKTKYGIIIVSVTLLIIIGFFIYKFKQENSNIQEGPSFQSVVSSEEKKEDKPQIKSEDIPAKIADDKNKTNNISEKEKINDKIVKKEINNITLLAVEKSWIKVTADEKTVFQGFVNKGDKKDFTADSKLEFKMGNGAGVKLITGNKVIGPFGNKGEVIKIVIKMTKEHID